MKIYFILFLFQVLSQGLLIFAYDDTSQDFLETLDASCIASRVPAPDINNGYVIKYDRKSFKDISYVIALYACDDNFEFEGNTSNVVYCSKDNWIGNLPKCKGTEDYNDYEEDDEDDEPSKNENYDSSESENNLVYQNEKNDLYENSEQERQTVIQSEGDDISNVINIEVAEEASVFEKKPIECPSNHECEHNCISAF
uniref:Sushi domain-containing protein n=1 Tax=Megaselia scalaris TaxID=36166 RepID=T1GYL6_MEGSC